MTTLPLLLFLLLLLTPAAGLMPLPSPSPTQCTSEIVSLSPCLSYISSLPNAAPDRNPTAPCFDAFSLHALGGGGACLCHLVRDPDLLGFPVNATRILELFSKCAGRGEAVAAEFLSLCKASGEIPPFRSHIPAAMNGKSSGSGSGSGPAPMRSFFNAADADSDDGRAPTIAPSDIQPASQSPEEKLSLCRSTSLAYVLTLFTVLYMQ